MALAASEDIPLPHQPHAERPLHAAHLRGTRHTVGQHMQNKNRMMDSLDSYIDKMAEMMVKLL